MLCSHGAKHNEYDMVDGTVLHPTFGERVLSSVLLVAVIQHSTLVIVTHSHHRLAMIERLLPLNDDDGNSSESLFDRIDR